MPPTLLQVVTAVAAALAVLVSFSALIVAVKSLRTARRSATAAETSAGAAGRSAAAAESNAAVATRAERRQVEQQHDAAGPRFEPEDAIVDDRMAEVRMKVVGGPRKMVVTARPDNVPWCRGVSSGASGQVGTEVTFPPVAPGATLTMTTHLTTDLWSGHEQDGHPMPLLLDVESREPDGAPERTWQRAAQVILRPPGPPPMSVPTRPGDRLPEGF